MTVKKGSPKARAMPPKLRDFLAGRLTSLAEVVDFPPNSAARFMGYAVALFKQKSFRAAELAAELAAHLDPKLTMAWRLLGAARAKQNEFGDAVTAYATALALDPTDAPTWCDLGEAQIAAGNFAAAATALKEVLRLDAKAETPHSRRARALVAKTLSRLRGR